MIAATHIAIGEKNQIDVNIAKDLLLEIAKANTLYNSISYKELKKKEDVGKIITPMLLAGTMNMNLQANGLVTI